MYLERNSIRNPTFRSFSHFQQRYTKKWKWREKSTIPLISHFVPKCENKEKLTSKASISHCTKCHWRQGAAQEHFWTQKSLVHENMHLLPEMHFLLPKSFSGRKVAPAGPMLANLIKIKVSGCLFGPFRRKVTFGAKSALLELKVTF